MRPILILLLLLLEIGSSLRASAAAAAAGTEAHLGMPAPPLQIGEWAQGGPLSPGKKGDTNIYVVEFWATWCGPCRHSIPRLSAMQTRFRSQSVHFVGISSEESGKVIPFVKQMGTNMNYAVAIDDKGKTTADYMEAFGETGIPHAFVIGRDQTIVWTGHPLAGLEQVLEDLIKGTFDKAKASAGSRFIKDAQRYLTLVASAGASPEASALGQKIVSDAKDQPQLLNQFVQVILFDNRIKAKDLKLALEAAKQSTVASGRTDPGSLQLYAHALARNGQKAEAIQILKEAVGVAKQPKDRETLEADIAEFQKSSASDK